MAELKNIRTEERLAAALIPVVQQRLRGKAFVRIPELVDPLPVDCLLLRLAERPGVRAAVFLEDWSQDSAPLIVTSEVHVAIDWRNEIRPDLGAFSKPEPTPSSFCVEAHDKTVARTLFVYVGEHYGQPEAAEHRLA